jgi:DNA-directed RNA polymerase specialized sigma subunit
MNKQQAQFNQDYDAKKVVEYWKNEYGVTPDAWELANELQISEKEAEKSLAHIAKSHTAGEESSPDAM